MAPSTDVRLADVDVPKLVRLAADHGAASSAHAAIGERIATNRRRIVALRREAAEHADQAEAHRARSTPIPERIVRALTATESQIEAAVAVQARLTEQRAGEAATVATLARLLARIRVALTRRRIELVVLDAFAPGDAGAELVR